MTTAQAAQAVEMMAVTRLRPAEDNPRDSLGELGELTDSIEAIGVLQPLTVIPTGEIDSETDLEIHLVVAGHRRLAAAILAERSEVPVIARTDIDEAGRQQAMFIENFHRLDLSVLERARSLRQLADAGVSQRDIGKKVGISQSTVSKWLKLLTLPEKAQQLVASGKLNQEDAVALASLPSDKVTEILDESPRDDLMPYRIGRAKQEVDDAKAKAAAEKTAAEKGWTVLAEHPYHFQQLGLEGDDKPVSLDLDRHRAHGLLGHVDPTEHETEECHAVHIDDDGDVTPACTNPSVHPKPRGWKSPAQKELEERAKAAGKPVPGDHNERRAQRAETRLEAVEKIEPVVLVCRRLIADANASKGFPGSVADYAAVTVLMDDDPQDYSWARDLLDMTEGGWRPEDIAEAIQEDPTISGYTALMAWGLGLNLRDLLSLTEMLIDGEEPEEDYVQVGQTFLGVLAGEGAPSYEEFVASLTEASDSSTSDEADGPTVEIYEKSGKYRRRCSECGELDGMNTKIELAEERKAQHLSEVHGVTDETAAA